MWFLFKLLFGCELVCLVVDVLVCVVNLVVAVLLVYEDCFADFDCAVWVDGWFILVGCNVCGCGFSCCVACWLVCG